jgi:hypothetical protein
VSICGSGLISVTIGFMSRAVGVVVIGLIGVLSAGPSASQVRTADPAKRGVALSAFPRTIKLADNVYGYEEIRQPGFTTVSLFVVGVNGVLVADGQGSPAATQTMLQQIRQVTTKPVKWHVGSDHGDHTAGNLSCRRTSPTSLTGTRSSR